MENKKHEILLGLTTTPRSDWRGKVEEMKKFGIKRIALFPTFLKMEDRKILYNLLEEIEGLEIPHVHLRNDMEKWELEMFKEKYRTEAFNTHGKHFVTYTYPEMKKFLPMIFIENQFYPISEECLEKCGGLCVDFTHWESAKLKNSSPAKMVDEFVKKYKVGCCHVSAIKGFWSLTNLVQWGGRDNHRLGKLEEVDYLKKYRQYLPKYVSLELENSFEEQLEVKKYIEEKILNN